MKMTLDYGSEQHIRILKMNSRIKHIIKSKLNLNVYSDKECLRYYRSKRQQIGSFLLTSQVLLKETNNTETVLLRLAPYCKI